MCIQPSTVSSTTTSNYCNHHDVVTKKIILLLQLLLYALLYDKFVTWSSNKWKTEMTRLNFISLSVRLAHESNPINSIEA